MKFKIWLDGDENTPTFVCAESLPDAYDLFANSYDYLDHADMAQSLGWGSDDQLNVVVLDDTHTAEVIS